MCAIGQWLTTVFYKFKSTGQWSSDPLPCIYLTLSKLISRIELVATQWMFVEDARFSGTVFPLCSANIRLLKKQWTPFMLQRIVE